MSLVEQNNNPTKNHKQPSNMWLVVVFVAVIIPLAAGLQFFTSKNTPQYSEQIGGSDSKYETEKYAEATKWFIDAYISYLQDLHVAEIIYTNLENQRYSTDYLSLLNQLRMVKEKYLDARISIQLYKKEGIIRFVQGADEFIKIPKVSNVTDKLEVFAQYLEQNTQNEIEQLEKTVNSGRDSLDVERQFMVMLSQSKEFREGLWAGVSLANEDIESYILTGDVVITKLGKTVRHTSCLKISNSAKKVLLENINEKFGLRPINFESLNDILEMMRNSLVTGFTYEDDCGTGISEFDTALPVLGEADKKLCPFCKHKNDKTNHACSYCHRTFITVQSIYYTKKT